MNSIKLTIFFLLLFANSIIAQQPKLIKTETQIYNPNETNWRGAEREFFEYSGDLLTKYTFQNFYSLPQEYVNSHAIENYYNDENQLILKKEFDYTSANAQVQNFYWDEYFYDNNGCLIAQKDSVSSIHGVYPQFVFEYEVDENCNILVEHKEIKNQNGAFYHHQTNKVYNTENQLIADTLYHLQDGNWKFIWYFEYEYDSKNRLEKRRKLFNGTTEHEAWTYDEQDELTLYIHWRETNGNPYKLVRRDSFELEYDEKFRVIHKTLLTTRFSTIDPVERFRYEYYCQDILKRSYYEYIPRNYRTIYEYDIGFDENCTEELEDSSLLIFPNPNNGEMILRSDLLGAESATIRVFDVTGKELFKQDYEILKNEISLDFSFLITGLYFISIETEQFIDTESFTIFK